MWPSSSPNISTRLILIRHGDIGDDELAIGQTDLPLSQQGREQLQETSERLGEERIDAIYSSNLSRSVQSAEILAAARNLTVNAHTCLGELDAGEWEGLPYQTIRANYPELARNCLRDLVTFRPPGGENMLDLAHRVLPKLHELLGCHRGGVFCIVAHALVNRVILFDAIGLGFSRFNVMAQDYGCINRIDYFADGQTTVASVNG